MRAVMLAAGVGNRLGDLGDRPKSLLSFGGRTLLQRHLENLAATGVTQLTICVGYRADLIRSAVAEAPLAVECVTNDDFRRGSLLSLWTVRAALIGDGPILLMDADVLYAPTLLTRLRDSTHANCMLLDENYIPGDEPVKICVAAGRIVEFRKKPDPAIRFDFAGESVGFFKLDAAGAAALVARCRHYVDAGRLDEPYEEPIRDLVLAGTPTFGFEYVAGLPWLEIDFPEDLVRARDQILPQLERLHD